MLNHNSLKNQLISRRTFIIGIGKIGLLFLLAGRMLYMQFIKKDEYKTLSDKNRIKLIIIPPIRGQIYDRNKKIIAKNNPCFRLLFDKSVNTRFDEEISLLVTILGLDEVQSVEVQTRVKKAGRRVPVVIIDYLSWEQIAVIEERKNELQTLYVDTGYSRFYQYGSDLAHLTGYLGKPDKNSKLPSTTGNEYFRTGKNGVEKSYETLLCGEPGFKRVEINAKGKWVRELSETLAIAGGSLHLNIDAELQKSAMSLLNPRGSSSILMDCQNGSIVVLASTPSFDPNNFNFLSSKYWNELIADPYKPLINKTVSSLYPPGSIFKLITALAALEAGIDENHIIHCDGLAALGGNGFRCAKKTGHGSINLRDAIKYSCNIYMFGVAQLIGAQKIIDTAKKYGFGIKTGIDLPSELAGFVPSPEWKKETLKTRWSLGDTLNLAIGQGFLLCTPMQIARFITAIASNGKLFTPKIAKADSDFLQIDASTKHLGFIKQALYNGVNAIGGTGYSGRMQNSQFVMAGKTGTAQVTGKKNADDDLSRENISWHRRNHAIFAGYGSYDNPKYSITVYYDHGGGGGKSAAPIAKAILEEALKREIMLDNFS